MKTKGNIGQVVYIPVTISEIKITKTGTTYTCSLPKDGICQRYDESEIFFLEPEEEQPKVVETETPEIIREPVKTGAAHTEKKRGRPRKATVEDLLNNVNSRRDKDIPNSAMDALAESKEGGENL